ncbi:helix-turn-helix domain-containing protein [Actinoplanes rectilineatus]|uniref:helix-turn-helix domain-containing protein n=1 Tax=Actinoplanes rectilineatus TaxID=113571 RepID=UPI0009F9D14F
MSSRTRELLQLLVVVNARLSEDVSLPALARWAHRSRFDLHRRFRRLTGQTPKAYTMRVRLARAAGDLVAGDHRVSVIAFDHGFGSHQMSPWILRPSGRRGNGLLRSRSGVADSPSRRSRRLPAACPQDRLQTSVLTCEVCPSVR